MKNTIGYILLTGAATSGLLAVWTPVGSWIQWLITGTILLIAGASILGTNQNARSEMPGAAQDATEPHNGTGSHPADPETPTGRTRPQYGKTNKEDPK